MLFISIVLLNAHETYTVVVLFLFHQHPVQADWRRCPNTALNLHDVSFETR